MAKVKFFTIISPADRMDLREKNLTSIDRIQFNPRGSIDKEIDIIYTRFISEVRKIDHFLAEGLLQMAHSNRKNYLLVCLPYWLDEAFDAPLPMNFLRSQSLANLYGTSFILMQDKLIDRQEDVLEQLQVSNFQLLSTTLYYRCVREYHRLFPIDNLFWALFEKYLTEYTRSSLWEKREHWHQIKDFSPEDFVHLGQKLSPLKICCAATCLLHRKKEWISHFSRIIENYHIGYQLTDDLLDWKDDLQSRNYTYLLTTVHKNSGRDRLSEEEIEKILRTTPVVKNLLRESTEYFQRARNLSAEVHCRQLCAYIDTMIDKNESLLGDYTGSPAAKNPNNLYVRIQPGAKLFRPELHFLRDKESCYIFNINRPMALKSDEATLRILEQIDPHKGTLLPELVRHAGRSAKQEVRGIIAELARVGLVHPGPAPSPVETEPGISGIKEGNEKKNREHLVAIGLQISRRVSGKIRTISTDIARKAINLLFIESGSYTQQHVFMFDCERLKKDEKSVIRNIIQHGHHLSQKLHSSIEFSITCDSRLLTDADAIRYLAASEIAVIAFTLDLDRKAARPPFSGIRNAIEELSAFRKNIRVVLKAHEARAGEAQDFLDMLLEAGIRNLFVETAEPMLPDSWLAKSNGAADKTLQIRIGNFHRIVDRIKRGKHYRYFCNAGKSYIAVSTDGRIYPCHKFASAEACPMGDLESDMGNSQSMFLALRPENQDKCKQCWARYLCGGGCVYDGVRDQFCESYRNQAEQAIKTLFRMQSDKRAELDSLAKLDVRACDLT